MRDVLLVSAVRTAVGRYIGAVKDIEAHDLVSLEIYEVIHRIGLEAKDVNQVDITVANVAPALYIACGNSSAPLYVKGMRSAKFAIAINRSSHPYLQ